MLDLLKFEAAEAWLAPMSGATDAPFRRQALEFGADAVISEMTASEQLLAERPDVVRRACRPDADSPWIVQLAGRCPEHMQGAAKLMAQAGVDMIDINMGCPARKVTGGLSGSALMREPELADNIISATLEGAGDVPVSLKMRLGWDDASLNAPELACRAEQAGVQLITVHGRTRCQFYKGEADWSRIADTVSAVSVPVIANGDIETTEQARAALEASGAQAVMLGRAAVGRPWLPAQIATELAGDVFEIPNAQKRLESLLAQLDDAAQLYGPALGVRICRKHISAAILHAPIDMSADVRRAMQSRLCQISVLEDLQRALHDVFARQETDPEQIYKVA
ncbi:MAG: tRNA-dihydrouridine synthase family protein [Hyphomonadaceae bacterium]